MSYLERLRMTERVLPGEQILSGVYNEVLARFEHTKIDLDRLVKHEDDIHGIILSEISYKFIPREKTSVENIVYDVFHKIAVLNINGSFFVMGLANGTMKKDNDFYVGRPPLPPELDIKTMDTENWLGELKIYKISKAEVSYAAELLSLM